MEDDTLERMIMKRFRNFEEKCREEIELVDEALGRPHITLDIVLPAGCEELKEIFEKLPEDEEFMKELEKFVRDYVKRKIQTTG
ncbi:MAG: hypothetical protein QXE91_02670 [Thermofilaceae archaeon]